MENNEMISGAPKQSDLYLGAVKQNIIEQQITQQPPTVKNFRLYLTHTIKFDFLEKLQILFGKKVIVYGELDVDKEVNVIKGGGTAIVEPFFKSKNKTNSTEQPKRKINLD